MWIRRPLSIIFFISNNHVDLITKIINCNKCDDSNDNNNNNNNSNNNNNNDNNNNNNNNNNDNNNNNSNNNDKNNNRDQYGYISILQNIFKILKFYYDRIIV